MIMRHCAKCPPGHLAHAYCDFMEREGLTAQGLVDEFDRFAKHHEQFRDQFRWYLDRMRDVHDMLHVLTGYGRDALGEACVLAFTLQPATFARASVHRIHGGPEYPQDKCAAMRRC